MVDAPTPKVGDTIYGTDDEGDPIELTIVEVKDEVDENVWAVRTEDDDEMNVYWSEPDGGWVEAD